MCRADRVLPVHARVEPLKTAQDCADVLTDLLSSVAKAGYAGRSQPAERHCRQRAELFGTIELAAEIDALKAQLLRS